MAAIGVMSYPARDSFNSYPLSYQQQLPREQSRSRSSGRRTPASGNYAAGLSTISRAPSMSSDGESRPLLPSISNLLGIAGARRPQDSPHDTQRPESQRSLALPHDTASRQYDQNSDGQGGSPTSQARHKRRYDGSDASAYAYDHRNMDPPSRQSEPGYDPAYPHGRQYMGSPGAASDGSYYSPTSTMSVQPGMHPGQIPAGYHMSQSAPNLSAQAGWEHHHHHYMGQPGAQQGMYPQLPDRYVCPICSKAFSRPSSLKIHSHSHTGEKPFKCPHAGCGKAFSVKSNMKRHEKGCHRAQGGQALGGAQADLE